MCIRDSKRAIIMPLAGLAAKTLRAPFREGTNLFSAMPCGHKVPTVYGCKYLGSPPARHSQLPT
eukprot:12420778-Prorocentrum_lima.AAC.1